MGMAASQARWLQLAARKSNVEFEGQQINQQRTMLATESSQFYSLLTALNVPIAPSSTDYTTTEYTFTDGAQDYTITDIKALSGNPDYNATVSYYYTTSVYSGISRTRSDMGVVNNGNYWLTDGTEQGLQRQLYQCTGTAEETTAIEQIIADNACSANFITDYDGGAGIGNIYYYTNSSGTTYFYSQTDLDNMPAQGAAGPLTSSYASYLNKNISQTSNAYIEKEDNGRYSKITLEGYSMPFDLTCTTTIDEAAYNDAYNEYQYKTALYNQEVQSINAQISIVQKQDQQLELRLNELDTEQKAMATEIDSVKKVIDKNVESTFKTFND